ncbi:MAG: rRNA maturation RNase YbeY [Pirellulales bacterium]|nr:rRNA maturation RNase YbeY [Pirellulales bacterium]
MSDPCSSRLAIEIADRQDLMRVDQARISQAVARILSDAEITSGELSIAIVDNREIHELNRRFLQHDFPTDVISFPFEQEPGQWAGEIVASAEMALSTATEIGWPAEAELLLYVIHGALHLVGHDDHDTESQAKMRAAEKHYLQLLDVPFPEAQDQTSNST